MGKWKVQRWFVAPLTPVMNQRIADLMKAHGIALARGENIAEGAEDKTKTPHGFYEIPKSFIEILKKTLREEPASRPKLKLFGKRGDGSVYDCTFMLHEKRKTHRPMVQSASSALRVRA